MMRTAIHDPLGVWLVTSLVVGLAAHIAIVLWHRRGYARLRSAYAAAVVAAQATGSAEALVRAEELHREFIQTRSPRWSASLGAHIRAGFVLCGPAVGMMVVAGRLSPVLACLALLFVLCLRRLLLGTALLLAVFVASSLIASPGSSDRARLGVLSSASSSPSAAAGSR